MLCLFFLIGKKWIYLEKHTPQTECGPSQTVKVAQRCGMVSFSWTNFIGWWMGGLCQLFCGRGRGFHELGHCPLFGPWWSASDLSWHLWVCSLVCWCVTVVVQSLNPVWPFVTPWTAALQASLTFTVSWSLLKLMSIESVMPPTILFFVAPFSFSLQSFPLSGSFPMSWLFA